MIPDKIIATTMLNNNYIKTNKMYTWLFTKMLCDAVDTTVLQFIIVKKSS